MSKVAIVELIDLPKTSTDVAISIRVGMSQSGMITFNESGKSIIQKKGSLNYTVQNSDTLDGKSFDFNILCTDVNPTSDRLEVTVDLILGGENKGPWTLSRDVNAGGSFQFFGTIEFMK